MKRNQKTSVNRLIDGFLGNKPKQKSFVSQRDVTEIINIIKHLFYPNVKKPAKPYFSKKAEVKRLFRLLKGQIKCATLEFNADCDAEKVTCDFFDALPKIKETLDKDLDAFIAGDPAAKSKNEVILCYPGFHAIFTYRLAHKLDELKVPVLPRVFTELAHVKTGIDVHPSAKIGERFFIDHGTGVVIGETSVIGNGVKLYQGVTLGAISLKNAEGLRGVKRHPTVMDGVTVYANATVLGGDTVIGENVTIPSAAFITKSVFKGEPVTD